MVKLSGYPRNPAYSLRNRTKTAWKVPMTSLRAGLEPTMPAIRSFISPAAFLVKVRARTLDGSVPPLRIYAILLVRTLVFPEPAPATISTGPSVQLTAFLCSSFSPSRIVLTLSLITARNYEKNEYLRIAILAIHNNVIFNVKKHRFEKGSEHPYCG